MDNVITVIFPDGTKKKGMPYLAVLGYIYISNFTDQFVEVVEMSEDKQTIWVESTIKRSEN